jgi:hypothetical protein
VDDKINDAERQEPPSKVRPAPDRIAIAILFGLVVLITISALNLYETHRQRNEFIDRMTQVLNAVNARVAGNSGNPSNQPTPPPGPDPDKVYTVRTQGAPAQGPKEAPIKIAEFSDFQ